VSGVLTLNTANVPEGLYTFNLAASGGVVNSFPIDLQSAYLWSGATQTNGGSANWNVAGNWVGGNAPPSASDDVVFTDSAGLASGIVTTNVLITSGVEIGSLRFSQAGSTTRRHNLQLDPGVTLKVTGTNGLWVLRDRTDSGNPFNVFFTGIGGSLVVSNEAAQIQMFTAINQASLFDMSALGTFVADVQKIGICDYRAYPHYDDIISNAYANATQPRQMPPGIRLARTNFIRASFPGDPNNYVDPAFRYYAFMYGNNQAGGTGTRGNFYFGISNVFYLSSICFHGAGTAGDQSGNNVFNPSLIASNCTAVFRNTNGTRMAMFAIADGAGPGASGSGTKGQLNFTGGTVDALVDRFWVARERTNSTGATVQGFLTMSGGTFDANSAILGFQGQGNNLGTGAANCQGTVNVSTSGVFRVNGTLELGYTTATAGHTTAAEAGFGKINISSGGTLMASNITVGGVTKVSGDNRITLTGGNLIVSNTIAGADKMLAVFSLSGASKLTLHLDGNNATPYVFATNFTVTPGTGNRLEIGSIQNVTIPAEIPLFYSGAGSTPGNFSAIIMPPGSGLAGNLVPSATDPNQFNLLILTNSPKTLAWRGFVDANWNTATKNWLDLSTGIQTNFNSGDIVIFDDVPTVTSINLELANLIPNTINITNVTKTYTFSGPGTISGSGTLNKWGSGTLALNGSVGISVIINEGVLTGDSSGILGSATIAGGAQMIFGGTINAGITCFGTATLIGSSLGALAVHGPSGTFTNLGTFTGPFSTEEGTLLVNETGANLLNTGSPLVQSNSTLINGGTILGASLEVAGTLKDLGTGYIGLSGTLTVDGGGTFVPGGDGIGTSTVRESSLFDPLSAGAVKFNSGSTNIIKVDFANPQVCSKLLANTVYFGPSRGVKAFDGGTIVINNIGSTPYSVGQTMKPFGTTPSDGSFPVGNYSLNTTNSYSLIEPVTPGFGMDWDLSSLYYDGVIRVIGVATAPTNLAYSTSFLTTISTNVPPVTNNYIVSQLSWPEEYIGWRLQQQVTTLEAGLSTNWSDLFTSWTNQITVTNVFTTNAVFFRMVYP
ncbi:MAG TPA: hypothetical protein VK327_09050, partial [Candidatus Paceibacterota bacterium]|nr:hypothetical protein [Candidatus Paceibacterota bacterium]